MELPAGREALVADSILAHVGMDRDGELTIRLKISLTEPFDMNQLRMWIHTTLRLYLVKETPLAVAGARPEIPEDGAPF